MRVTRSATDPSNHLGVVVAIDIEKLTNGNQADGANDADVPQIAPGDPVTWSYVVTNTGDVAFDEADVDVTDKNLWNRAAAAAARQIHVEKVRADLQACFLVGESPVKVQQVWLVLVDQLQDGIDALVQEAL